MAEIDLNLLRVFDTLFELRSVTRAAARLNLTQSAVSHALGRLRHAIGDPLFVRGAAGLQPTARAVEVAPGLHEGLTRLRDALAPSAFEPTAARREFTLSASAYFCALLIPALLAALRQAAPGVSIRIRPPGPDLPAELDEGRIELALGVFGALPPRFSGEVLFSERMVWVAAADHPLVGRRLDLRTVAAHPRLSIETGRPFEVARAADDGGGLERRLEPLGANVPIDRDAPPPVAIAYDTLTATTIVGATDLVALVPSRFAQRNAARDGIVTLDVEGDVGAVRLEMIRHRKSDGDHGLAWLRAEILRIVGDDPGARVLPLLRNAD